LTQPLGSPTTTLGSRLSAIGPHCQSSADKGTLLTTMWSGVVRGLTDQINRAAAEFYVTRLPGAQVREAPLFATRLAVWTPSAPFDPRSAETLELIQLWLRQELPKHPGAGGVRAECYGITVNARDLATITESDRLRINTLVLAGIFLILLALVRRPGLAVYLLVTVLFSYYASLGATTLLAHWWSGRPLGLVDWRVPFFLFTILVAVGEDYNILLITRALEEGKRHGSVEGMR